MVTDDGDTVLGSAATGPTPRLRPLGFVVIGTVPGAFRHARHGYVGLHVMYRSLVES